MPGEETAPRLAALRAEAPDTFSARATLLQLEAKSYAADLQTAFANEGLTGLTVKVNKGVGVGQ